MSRRRELGGELTRRHFLRLGGALAVVGLGACSSEHAATPSTGRAAPGSAPPSSAPATTASAPSTAPARTLLADRRLVIVQLNGGNDGLNTVVPLAGTYHDARPTLGIADTDLVALDRVADIGLHPALRPLTALWDAGHLAIVRGIGFQDPDRSHFVSMDRWWRADDAHAPGWLGRVLDGLASEPAALYATALGGTTPVLSGAGRQGASVSTADGFAFDAIAPSTLQLLATPPSDLPLLAAAQHAFARAVDAVTDFDRAIAGTTDDAEDDDGREGGATITGGLQLAARLLAADVGTRIVVVSAGGFDTHSGQADTQQRLLADLATGMTAFSEATRAAGLDVLLATTSEFGRRVQENGSGGTDHGAGNVSFVAGRGVSGGVVGEVDLTDLLDGDVRPTVDPRTMYTACLDWIGADAAAVLGTRFDEVRLLAG